LSLLSRVNEGDARHGGGKENEETTMTKRLIKRVTETFELDADDADLDEDEGVDEDDDEEGDEPEAEEEAPRRRARKR
jgi:hypothetical protein